MRRWRLGIIGCGWAGEQHARAISLLKDRGELAAVADIEPMRAERMARTWGVPVATDDYQRVIASESLDAVSICLPHHLHAPVAIGALEAGLHVLVEKPMATTLAEADAMIAAADAAGVQLMVAENVRFDPTSLSAAARVNSGALGEPITSAREARKPLVAVLATYASIKRSERVYIDEFESRSETL